MLTGDEQSTDGEAQLSGFNLADNPQKFLANIGYCPQFDALLEHMTGREMLFLFCRLRGIPKQSVASEAMKWIEFLGKINVLQVMEGVDYSRYVINGRIVINSTHLI